VQIPALTPLLYVNPLVWSAAALYLVFHRPKARRPPPPGGLGAIAQ